MSDIERAGTSRDPEQIGKTIGRPKSVASVRKLLGKALGKEWIKREERGSGRGFNGGSVGARQKRIRGTLGASNRASSSRHWLRDKHIFSCTCHLQAK